MEVTAEYRPSMVHAEPNPQIYVLGFAFTHTMKSVVLIEKRKPAWQAGKLNGVGGKFENSDSNGHFAMSREFAEETGHIVEPELWHLFEIMRFKNGAIVYCYTVQLREGALVRTMEDEVVDAYPIDDVNGTLICELEIINNLNWLVPKAYHQLREPKEERLLVE